MHVHAHIYTHHFNGNVVIYTYVTKVHNLKNSTKFLELSVY